MAAVTVDEMRSLEKAAMAAGWSEEALMNLAGKRLGRALANHFPHPGTAIAYLGKGHNAGDALVALRVLRDQCGWKVLVRPAFPMEQCSPLTRRKWEELGADPPLESLPDPVDCPHPWLLLDGLLGIGGKGALLPPLLDLAGEMHALQITVGAKIAAVDGPSGVDCDSGEIFPGAVHADVTFMIACPKRGLLTSSATPATGALALVPVEPLTRGGDHRSPLPVEPLELIAPQASDFQKTPRPFDFHKGRAGKIGILAGSTRFAGAAVFAVTGALRGGAGLVTLHVPPGALPFVAPRCPPEVIVAPCENPRELLELEYDAWVIGCGLSHPGGDFTDGLLNLIAGIRCPAVLDAEALNVISERNRLDLLSERHVITPHPGEFRRLAPDLKNLSREEAIRSFSARTGATILLKGSRTLLTRRGEGIRCNATGTPGMATGGQGDLLSGVIGALLPGNDPLDAATLAAWTCGRAAERALDDPCISEESLLPSDVLRHIGGAFTDWKRATR